MCLWYRSRFRHTASSLHSFAFFSLDQEAAVGSLLRVEVVLANTSLLLNTLRKKMISWSRTWLIDILAPSFANRQNCSHNRAAKHIKISCLPRESSLNHLWPSWILPQAIRDIQLLCPWFVGELDYCSKSIIIPRAFTGTSECPDIKNTIDCACLQSYIPQILPSSRYYKE